MQKNNHPTSFLLKRKLSKYQKLCHRLKKKWQQGTWKHTSVQQRQNWLQRLHRYEHRLQKWGIATTFSLSMTLWGVAPSNLNAQAPKPEGGEFWVNTVTGSDNGGTGSIATSPSIGMDADGNFVIAWQSVNQEGASSGYGVYAQRYNNSGDAQDGVFLVNTETNGNQNFPSVGMDSDGDFVIAWQGSDGDGEGIFIQRYNSSGVAQGGELLVNTITNGAQRFSSVAMDLDGNFVVAWHGPDGSNTGIYARRYNSVGVPLDSNEFLVNTVTAGTQTFPSIAMDSDGDFIIAWHSSGQDGNGYGVFARRYNSSGSPIDSNEFLVNTETGGNQTFPSVGMDADGDFVIAWQSSDQDGYGVFARRYHSNGNPLDSNEFLVNTETSDNQRDSNVRMDSDGNFVIVWESDEQDGSYNGVYMKRYTSNGDVKGGELLVNTETNYYQRNPKVGIDSDGDFIVTWESKFQQPGVNTGIYAQRYTLSNPEVPTLSEWGLLNLALLLMITGTLYLVQPDFRRGILEEEG